MLKVRMKLPWKGIREKETEMRERETETERKTETDRDRDRQSLISRTKPGLVALVLDPSYLEG